MDFAYRLTIGAVAVMAGALAARAGRRAARTPEAISYQQEGRLFARLRRASGVALWLATLAYLLTPAAVAWAAAPLPSAVRWWGVAPIGLGLWLMQRTLAALGPNLTDTVVVRTEAFLVTEGPYRWVRHPYYGAAALLMGGVTLLSANLLIAATSAAVLGLLAVRTPYEEAALVERFGDAYRHYQQTTGRFFPSFNWRRQ
jgi:protein-S-isoprenylcysteine O-methyltransferase Ste14